MPKRVIARLHTLETPKKIALAGAVLLLLSLWMPWHTTGFVVANAAAQHVYNGFADQNFVIGLLAFLAAIFTLIISSLPLFSFRLPRLPWREGEVIRFLGGEVVLLISVLITMYSVSYARTTVSLRGGIYLALIGAALIFFAGILLAREERARSLFVGEANPLAAMPRHRERGGESAEQIRKQREQADEDSRMRFDI